MAKTRERDDRVTAQRNAEVQRLRARADWLLWMNARSARPAFDANHPRPRSAS